MGSFKNRDVLNFQSNPELAGSVFSGLAMKRLVTVEDLDPDAAVLISDFVVCT